jgi:DNA replication initiation complex subunit (GINS family)
VATSELRGDRPPADRERRRPSLEDEEEFSYAALVNRWRRERSTTTLTKMDGDFYERFDRYLQQLHADYQREQAVNPATPKVLILLDELTNLQRVRDDLYDLREKKIVTSALIAARDGRPDRSNLTREEGALFDNVLLALQAARQALLKREAAPPRAAAPKAPGGPAAPLDPVEAPAHAAQPAAALAERPPRPAEAAPEAPLPVAEAPAAPRLVAPAPMPEELPGGAAAVAGESEARRAVAATRVLVRVKSAIEPFVAPDLRHYHLRAEDVAALPREVAHVLIQRGLAATLGA